MLKVSHTITAAGSATDVEAIHGLNDLWAKTLGDPRVVIAVVDGPIDQSHPSLAAANLIQLETSASDVLNVGPASKHGTHIASIIFGQHDGTFKGIAPRCRGLILPIFKDGVGGDIASCSQLDLARAILLAVQHGAHIINISGGELSPSGTAHPLLADVVQRCGNHALIVAAAGNEGCDCLHIPSSLPSVLAVGAMNSQGMPFCTNWGERYRTQGILAPGENILGAIPGGGTTTGSGTSYATSIVSGIAALLLGLQLKLGQQPNINAVRVSLLSTADGCKDNSVEDCRRLLAGRLNLRKAVSEIMKGGVMSGLEERHKETQRHSMEDAGPKSLDDHTSGAATAVCGNATECAEGMAPPQLQQPTAEKFQPHPIPLTQSLALSNRVQASACSAIGSGSCACGTASPIQLVFALGMLGYDFGTEARRDSILQHMTAPANPHDPTQLLEYLEKNPWDAAAILWTLNLDATPIYAIQARGPFADDIYERLRVFLGEQTKGEAERISVPGYIGGNTKLFTGQVVPVIWPEPRGMYSWNTMALVEAVSEPATSSKKPENYEGAYSQETQAITNFLRRIYDELRNLGITSPERALNYAATNAFQIGEVFREAIKDGMDLETIEVERSPLCRPESDCWDVKLTFFNPGRVFEQARKVFRFTVDVSDVVPVMVGPVRSWFVR